MNPAACCEITVLIVSFCSINRSAAGISRTRRGQMVNSFSGLCYYNRKLAMVRRRFISLECTINKQKQKRGQSLLLSSSGNKLPRPRPRVQGCMPEARIRTRARFFVRGIMLANRGWPTNANSNPTTCSFTRSLSLA